MKITFCIMKIPHVKFIHPFITGELNDKPSLNHLTANSINSSIHIFYHFNKNVWYFENFTLVCRLIPCVHWVLFRTYTQIFIRCKKIVLPSFEKVTLRAASLEKLPFHVDFVHISSIALFYNMTKRTGN